MSATEPLRPPLEHEVCGTCRWWADEEYHGSGWGRCHDVRHAIWWEDRSKPHWTVCQCADGCQCWEARGAEESER